MAFVWHKPLWQRKLDTMWRWVWREPEPITMLDLNYGYLPARFAYAGAQQRVQRVVRSWVEHIEAPFKGRRCFAVHCTSGSTVTVAQDLRTGAWYMIP